MSMAADDPIVPKEAKALRPLPQLIFARAGCSFRSISA